MAWTEQRKRKVLAVIDGLMAVVGCISLFKVVYLLCNWVQANDNHNYWMAGSVKLPLAPEFHLLQAIMPESLSLLSLFITIPMAIGYLSYACDESFFTKACRWIMVFGALAVIAAVIPILDSHNCLCGSEHDEGWFDHGWDEAFLPLLGFAFLAYANRKAHRRWAMPEATTSPSREAPAARPSGDAPPSL